MSQETIDLLLAGITGVTWQSIVMIAIAGGLLYLAIARDYEPLLLVPIAAGAILANLPLSPMIGEDGLLSILYDAGIENELFPLIIFIGIGAMTDFGPLLENPRMILLGAAGQVGIFSVLILALLLGFTRAESASIGIIGAIDGPTSIYVSGLLAPHLLGPITVAAYSYMALVPVIMPPIMRALTSPEERRIRMRPGGRVVGPGRGDPRLSARPAARAAEPGHPARDGAAAEGWSPLLGRPGERPQPPGRADRPRRRAHGGEPGRA